MNKNKQITHKAKILANRLSGLTLEDALLVINQAELIILKLNAKKSTKKKRPVIARRPQSCIGRNNEIKSFIDDLLGIATYEQIANYCQDKFGKQKGLSKTSIGRYGRQRFLENINS